MNPLHSTSENKREAIQFTQLPKRMARSVCVCVSACFVFEESSARLSCLLNMGETELVKLIGEMERVEEKLVVFTVDVLDYHSILEALKGCNALFCCSDSPQGYDVS
ncbi:hypothetical protein ACSBR1_022863 [Camellia fascicularis]